VTAPHQFTTDRNSRLYITTRPIESQHKFHRGASSLSVVEPVSCPKTSVIIPIPCQFCSKTEQLNPEETTEDSTDARTQPQRVGAAGPCQSTASVGTAHVRAEVTWTKIDQVAKGPKNN
jgi:hypothetical protein